MHVAPGDMFTVSGVSACDSNHPREVPQLLPLAIIEEVVESFGSSFLAVRKNYFFGSFVPMATKRQTIVIIIQFVTGIKSYRKHD
jgi:hypothetical protein